MTKDEALQIFRDSGALLEGHFVLRSGLHSRQFFQCALALQQMPVVEKFGEALAAKVKTLGAVTRGFTGDGYGLVIGQEVARQLGLRFIFVEKEEGKLVLRRGFKIGPGEKILVVEDVVTKGGRVQETLDIVRAHGGNVVGVAMVVDRSNGKVNFGVPLESLISLQVETFAPNKFTHPHAGLGENSSGSSRGVNNFPARRTRRIFRLFQMEKDNCRGERDDQRPRMENGVFKDWEPAGWRAVVKK